MYRPVKLHASACVPTHASETEAPASRYIRTTRQWIRTGTIGIPEGRVEQGPVCSVQYSPPISDRASVARSSKFINISTIVYFINDSITFWFIQKLVIRKNEEKWKRKRTAGIDYNVYRQKYSHRTYTQKEYRFFGTKWNLIPRSYDLQSSYRLIERYTYIYTWKTKIQIRIIINRAYIRAAYVLLHPLKWKIIRAEI